MRNLLFANLFRLRRSRCFWALAAVMLLSSLGLVLMEANETYEVLLERVMFQSLAFYGVIAAAFVGLFLGMEYGDGAVRNKLAVGAKRGSAYLAGFLTASAACVLFYGLAIAAAGITGYFLLGTRESPSCFLTAFALGLLGCFAYCGLYSLIVMACQNKAVGAVCCLGTAIFLLAMAMFVNLRLAQPQIEQVIQGTQVVEVESAYYLTGLRREAFELLQLLSPTGQATKIITLDLNHPWKMALCSAAFTAMTIAAGAALFHRKDLK